MDSGSKLDEALTRTIRNCAAADRRAGRAARAERWKTLLPGREELVERAYQGSDGDTGSALPDRLGPYRLLGEIGRGGQGVVWLAEDERLRRRVALKLLLGVSPDESDRLERFRREALVASRLDHPGLCTIFEAGVHDGVPFIAMRYVEGRGLDEMGAELRTAGARAIAALVERAARALHVAHEAGIVHRDIKPANLRVTTDGEPVLVDFGLASAPLAGRDALTRTGDVFGTPAYMAPEQVLGRAGDVDRRADVWALGVTLFEALTGVRPFEGVTRLDLFESISRDPLPRAPMRSLPRDLRGILERALAKEPGHRYPAAAALADDLARFLAREPVHARPAGPLLRLLRFADRNRGAVGWGVAVFGALGVAWIVSLALLRAANGEERAKVVALGAADLALSDLRAQERATSAALARRKQALDEILKLSDRTAVRQLVADAELLWPATPELVVSKPGLDDWIAHADAVLKRADSHRRTLEALTAGAAGGTEPAIGAWQRQQTRQLLEELQGLEKALDSVRQRRAFALLVDGETLEKPAAAWTACALAVREGGRTSEYRGLELKPQRGLIPLGADPVSGLEEFAHLASGRPARRDPRTGKLRPDPECGLVFVLLPAGRFRMGAMPPSDAAPAGSPNVDPEAQSEDGPVREIEVAPFFISKYEMTRAQWVRVTGWDPAPDPAPEPDEVRDERNAASPIGDMTFEEGLLWMWRLGLDLPTEAQWEYAARAGTSTVWFTGDDPKSLDGFANLSDRTTMRIVNSPSLVYEEWLDDGFAWYAPVGSLLPNDFGLHDVVGNAWEFCREERVTAAACSGGARFPDAAAMRRAAVDLQRFLRGGSYMNHAAFARSAMSKVGLPSFRGAQFGLRPVRRLEP